MVMSNPAPLAEFWGTLPLLSAPFRLGGGVVSSRTEDGSTITARRGTRLWGATVTLSPRHHRAAEAIKARLEVMSDAGWQFMAHPFPVFSSAGDPTGALTLSASPPPSIYSLPSSGIEIRIGGLQTGYRLEGGEFLGFEYGGMQALHQIVGGAYFAGGEGRSPAMQIVPAIRPGAVTGLAVTLYKPVMRAIIVPGSVRWGSSDHPAVTSGISFDIIQQLRA